MKKFWQWPLGQRVRKNNQGVGVGRWLMLPFFFCLLVMTQLKDVGELGMRMVEGGVKWLSKDWGITIILGAVVIVLGWQITFFLGQEKVRVENARREGEKARVIIEEAFALPPEIKIATDRAQIRLKEQEIVALSQEADGLTAEKIGGLTQKEMLNYALAFYYLGNQKKYQQWLEWGRAMDPNDENLLKE
jgi:hypothetical protein